MAPQGRLMGIESRYEQQAMIRSVDREKFKGPKLVVWERTGEGRLEAETGYRMSETVGTLKLWKLSARA
jgi:hypothetical protein